MMEDRAEALVTSTEMSEKLRQKNVAFFEENDSLLAQAIKNAPDAVTQLSFVDDEIDNIVVNGTPLYGTDCHTYTKNQLKDFWAKPEEIVFDDVSNYNLSPISRGLMEILNEDFFYPRKNNIKTSNKPVVDQGYCFVFGLGLGLFLNELIEKKIARNIIIIEPLAEFFFQSLSVLDWSEIYEKADKNGIRIHYSFFKDPNDIVEHIEGMIRKFGNTFLDGSSYFMHYPSWENMEAYKLLRERIKIYFQSSGFYEDELIMIKNTYLNMI